MQPFKYEPKVNSGKLRNRVELFGNIKYINELKETAYRYERITRLWADVIPQTGKLQNQQQQANTILTNVTHKIITRYNRIIDDAYHDEDEQVRNSLYIMHRRHRFNVRFILNPYFRNETLEIFVEEVLG